MNANFKISHLTFLTLINLPTFTSAAYVIRIQPGSCTRINDAIKALPAAGGVIELAAGVYECSEPVVIDRDNVTLKGAGSAKVTLVAAQGLAIPVVIIGATVNAPEETQKWGQQFYPIRVTRNTTVSGIKIDGNYHTHSNPHQHECYDPKTKVSQTCDNDGGRFIRNNGLTIRRAERVRVSDLDTTRNFSGGIVLEKKSRDVIIDGFRANDNFFDGFAGYETSGSVFRNFLIEKNRFSGISVDMGFEGNTLEKGIVRENLDNGIFTANVGSNTYSELRVYKNKNFPIYMDGVRRFPNWPDTNPAIIVPGTCENNLVQNSLLDARGSKDRRSAVRVDHVCQGFRIENVKMISPTECIGSHEGAQILVDSRSTCTIQE